MRSRSPILVVSLATALGLGVGACEIGTEGDDPAEMEPVEQQPGDQNGDPADAEGTPRTDPQTDDDPGSERVDD